MQELGLDDDVTKDVRVDDMPGADRVVDSVDQESDSLPDEIRRHPEKYGMKVNGKKTYLKVALAFKVNKNLKASVDCK